MKRLALKLALTAALAIAVPAAPAIASNETLDAKLAAGEAAAVARDDMFAAFGDKELKPGQYVWQDPGGGDGPLRLVVGLTDQLAYLYRGDELIAVSTISSGEIGRDTPTGQFTVLEKKKFHRSIKYDNAPMPHMQRIDQYGIALHGGHNPGYPASHGCIRLPQAFAARLYALTRIGTEVWIGS